MYNMNTYVCIICTCNMYYTICVCCICMIVCKLDVGCHCRHGECAIWLLNCWTMLDPFRRCHSGFTFHSAVMSFMLIIRKPKHTVDTTPSMASNCRVLYLQLVNIMQLAGAAHFPHLTPASPILFHLNPS